MEKEITFPILWDGTVALGNVDSILPDSARDSSSILTSGVPCGSVGSRLVLGFPPSLPRRVGLWFGWLPCRWCRLRVETLSRGTDGPSFIPILASRACSLWPRGFPLVHWFYPTHCGLSLVCGVELLCQDSRFGVHAVVMGSQEQGRSGMGLWHWAVCGEQLGCRPARLCGVARWCGGSHGVKTSVFLQCARKDRTTTVVMSEKL